MDTAQALESLKARLAGPLLRPAERLLARVDGATQDAWGFYQVIEARKPAGADTGL